MKSKEIFNKLNVNDAWEYKTDDYPKLLNMPTEEEEQKPDEGEKDPEEDKETYEEVEIDGITYRINKKNNTAEVIDIIDDANLAEILKYQLEIPEKIKQNGKTYIVTAIGKEAFKESMFSDVKLPETIRAIGTGAFENSKIRSIYLPEGLTKLEDNVFKECNLLLTLYIPKSVTLFGKNIFENHNVMLFIFGYTKSVAEEYATENSINFMAVDDPEGKGDCVVDGLIYKLNKTDKTATVVGMKRKLILEIANQLKYLKIFNDIEFEGTHYQVKAIGKEALKGGQFSEIFIDFGIETIESEAFTECNNVVEIRIPYNVSKIDIDAFKDCENLTKVTISADNQYYTIENTKIYDNQMEMIDNFLWDWTDKQYYYSTEENVILYDKDMKILYGCIINTHLPYVTTDNKTSYLGIPDSVTEIKENAFDKCKIYENAKIYIGTNVTKIADNAFDKVKSKLTIRGYTNSYAEEYAKKHNIVFESIGFAQDGIHDTATKFIFGKDNFNFSNSAIYFDSYTIGDYKKYLCNSALEWTMQTEKGEWAGSCAGFAIVTALFKYGYLTPEYWNVAGKDTVENVYDLEDTKKNKRLMWLINFYWNFAYCLNGEQIGWVNFSSDDDVSNFFNGVKDYYDNIENDYDYLYCSFDWYIGELDEDGNEKSTGHAVTIIGGPELLTESFYEDRKEIFKKYKYRIPICDCNSSEERYIYIQDDMKGVTIGSDKKVDLYGSNAETMENKNRRFINIEARKYNHEYIFSLEELIKSGKKIKFDNVAAIRYNNSADIKIENKQGDFAKIKSKEAQISEGSLQCTISPEIDTTAEADNTITHNYVTFEDGDYYSIETLNDTDSLEASMQFGDSYMRANTLAGGKAIFEDKKSVTLTNPSGKQYEVALTLNDEFMTLPWYTITASGKDTKDIKLEMVEEGTLVSGDNLKELKITGNNSEETVDLNINTDKDKVLIKANSDETKLIAFIDTDGDGTYETPLNSNQTEDDNKENDVNKGNEKSKKEEDTNKENEANKENNENNKDDNKDNNESNKNQEKDENNSSKDKYDLPNNNLKTGDYIIYVIITLVVSLVAIAGICIFKHFLK